MTYRKNHAAVLRQLRPSVNSEIGRSGNISAVSFGKRDLSKNGKSEQYRVFRFSEVACQSLQRISLNMNNENPSIKTELANIEIAAPS